MKINPQHLSLLLVFGALSAVTVLLGLYSDWNAWRHLQQGSPGKTVILTPEDLAELWRPVQAGTSTRPVTAAQFKAIAKPVKGSGEMTAGQEQDLFRPVQGN